MLSLLGSLLGFGTSFLPSVMDYFKEKRDQAQELRLIAAQSEAQAKAGARKLEAQGLAGDIAAFKAALQADAKITVKSSQWVINLSASVRPCLAYLFFIEFMLLTVAIFFGWITTEQYASVWNEETQAIWAAIVSFYYGQRSMGKRR